MQPLAEAESGRIQAARALCALDLSHDEGLLDLVRLAALVCKARVAFVSFVDADQETIACGINTGLSQIERKHSFAAITIQQKDVLLLDDCSKDDRFRRNPLVRDEGCRFYAGAALIVDGLAVGALSVTDRFARTLSEEQADGLTTLAKQSSSYLVSKRLPVLPGITRQPRADVRKHDPVRSSLRRLEEIVDAAMDAIITIDNKQRIVMFNKAAETIFRCKAAEVMRQPLDRLIPDEFRTTHRIHVDNFAQTGSTLRSMHSPARLAALRADGETFAIEATISQVQIGEEKLMTVILRETNAQESMDLDRFGSMKLFERLAMEGAPRTESILVVEDDTSLRNLVCSSLQLSGFRVLSAGDGVEALDILRSYLGIIHLVISDVDMPRLNGLELRKRVPVLRPEAKFMFMSGHTRNETEKKELVELSDEYMEKPFLTKDLILRVEKVLKGSAKPQDQLKHRETGTA